MGMWFPIAREAALLKPELVIETKYSLSIAPSNPHVFPIFLQNILQLTYKDEIARSL